MTRCRSRRTERASRQPATASRSLDRGYGHLTAQQRLWEEDGIHTNAMVQIDRVGLPREFLRQISRDLESCPAKCSHKPDAVGCRKFRWTVCHRGDFEVCAWQDSKLILSYGNFFSSIRAGLLSRGSHGDKDSYSVWAPESIWHYKQH
mmetsp:Transcript_31616/g.78761  ORF Transcript_31616/g.78761 Transcript_31616/m.78761 type:complete len:148 (+) Transcript_31616:129-572(+)